MKKILSCVAVLMLLSGAMSMAVAEDAGKVSGYMFGDYYYVVSSPDIADEDINGFQFRRIYLTYDKDLDGDFSTRLRLEMAQPDGFSASSKMTPAVKDAYLKYKKGNASWYFGLASSPTWGSSVEKTWGYRSVEKTPMDLQKMGSSRDVGVAVKGKLADKKVWYHFMAGNGASNKSETNKYKKVMGALGVNLTDELMAEAYADYHWGMGDSDVMTLQGFAAYKHEKATLGLQYVYQQEQTGPDTEDLLRLASAFLRGTIREDLGYFARFDMTIDVNPSAAKISYLPFAPDAESNFMVFGLDWEVAKNVHVMPNVEVVTFSAADDNADDPESTVMPRLTAFYKF